ncbi:MAG: hypothetical protein MUC29_09105, partial [Pyrinomonadaceae bacterium]|nr:hypothetical protein [Pyrinomonadaceae bacterium]
MITESLNTLLAVITLCGVIFSLISTFVVQREQLKSLRIEHSELAKEFYVHKENHAIHFDEKTAKQVEMRLSAEIE